MGLRELLILLLGLAIVAVILRGLYVAIQARRGQIRLAIDKNIPQDVDLEALELAELPGGGARVVRRDGEDDSLSADPVTEANERAASMQLGRDDQAVPVLMDTVQLGSAIETNTNSQAEAVAQAVATEQLEEEPFSEDFSDDDGDEQSWQDEQAWRSEPQIPATAAAQFDEEQSLEDEQDDVLFDYDATDTSTVEDGLAAVQPDYPDEESDEDDPSEADDYQDEVYATVDNEGEYDAETEAYDEDEVESFDAASTEFNSEMDPPGQQRVEPSFDPNGLGDDLDSFSMTAGERIGGNPAVEGQGQASMFAAEESAAETEPGKRKSLFSAISGRIRSQVASIREIRQAERAIEREENLVPPEEDIDVQASEAALPDSIPTEQLDIESPLVQESHDLVPEPVEPERGEPITADLRTANTVSQRSEVRKQENSTQSSEVLVINVMAHEGREFRGEDLMHTIITCGLKYGDMQIFHHRFGNSSSGPVLFSLANILNPGTFDLNNMSQFTTIGVSLFMAMPTPVNNLDAFEQMLAVAQQLCSTLDGELKDDHRNVMTAQTIEHYRQRIRDFELRQLKTAGSRG